MAFPKDFVWGVAASSYQIEGALAEDGRKPSVWDMFCARPGAIWMGHNAAVACDHWHRHKEDVALMKQLGMKAYRLSIAWPRVIPDGTGAVNAKALDFYSRLVDDLLAAGIEPWVTLFHWDFPYDLYCRGGWLNRDVAEWFAEYSAVVARRLGDRVTKWMTINEPECVSVLGHQIGIQAPGDKLAPNEVVRVMHHLLLSHGRSVQAVRANAKSKPSVGLVFAARIFMPATESAADIEAARTLAIPGKAEDLWANGWWMDPVLLGKYPESFVKHIAPPIEPGDMEIISQKTDFMGMNLYNGAYIRATANGPEEVPPPEGVALTSIHWPFTPEAYRWATRFAFERYKLPIYITEGGMGGLDCVSPDGQVRDPQRIAYLHRYFLELEKVIAEGVDVRGHFIWSS